MQTIETNKCRYFCGLSSVKHNQGVLFNTISFLKDWSDNAANNAGFVIELARVDTAKKDCGSFASFDHVTLDYYPQLEISFVDWTGVVTQSINYSFPTAGRVSMLIRDDKKVIKEVFWAKAQIAGAQQYDWDARDEKRAIVPDGQYTAKILQTQGLTAEYMGVLGISVPQYEGWMGNHFAPLSLAVDDTAAVYIAGGGEITPSVLKMKHGGARLWTGDAVSGIPVPQWEGFASTASDGGNLYLLSTDRMIRVIACDSAPRTYTNFLTGITVAGTRSGLVYSVDMDVRNGTDTVGE